MPRSQQAEYIAAAVRSGRYTLSDPAFADFVGGTLAAVPQVDAMVLGDGDGGALRVLRAASGAGFRVDHFEVGVDSQVAAEAGQVHARKEPFWGTPVYRTERGETYLNYRVPIWSGDAYLGFVLVGISTPSPVHVQAKSLSNPPIADRVHPVRPGSRARPSADGRSQLRSIVDPDIPAAADIRRSGHCRSGRPAADPRNQVSKAARRHRHARRRATAQSYFIFAREVADYKELPITVGTYLRTAAIDAPLQADPHWRRCWRWRCSASP